MKMTKEAVQKAATLAITDIELESICDQICALKDLLEENRNCLMGVPKEQPKSLDIDQDEIDREVAEKLGLPLCLVKRVVNTMCAVLNKHGSNCMVFTEAEKDEE